MVPPASAGLPVDVEAGGGKDPLPGELPRGARIFPIESVGQLHAAEAPAEIDLMELANAFHLAAQRLDHLRREHGHPVLPALAVAYRDFPPLEVDVLHAEAQALQQPESRAVQE